MASNFWNSSIYYEFNFWIWCSNVGMSEKEYSDYMRDKTAVAKGTDFVYRNIRYQVKANRPSGKKGSKVTMVPKASNYECDRLIWILYDKDYVMQEAWEWYVEDYRMAFENKKRLSPEDYRKGHCLYHSWLKIRGFKNKDSWKNWIYNNSIGSK